jgi:thiol peroxidase
MQRRTIMTGVTLGGNPITVAGNFPKKGDSAPEFSLTTKDLKEMGLKDYAGKRKVLHSELVPEIKQEPDYDAALAALK